MKTSAPSTPVLVSLSITVPVTEAVLPVGGTWKSSAGSESPASVAPANQPMPRLAKIFQRSFWCEPPKATWSACRIALRMSSIDGSAGDSSIPRVMSDRAAVRPSFLRMSHSVWAQTSPDACTSGAPPMVGKSP